MKELSGQISRAMKACGGIHRLASLGCAFIRSGEQYTAVAENDNDLVVPGHGLVKGCAFGRLLRKLAHGVQIEGSLATGQQKRRTAGDGGTDSTPWAQRGFLHFLSPSLFL
ncbi:hypothetical protein IPC448_26430 [Pseudomonas aeruginosa]|uniref:hypothetical protein n=1 Tax=Pseudomonas aeruginosa TaxID=287 RepID=UPI000FD36613|nr:hypothetical protein [Pseudomonas aeruginosa]RUI12886.1 hypothetical protein IPC448_26430 [Pseudomonas aeruginosa]